MAEKAAWHEAYPKPRNQQPGVITREELLLKLQQDQKPGIDFLMVDLRRTDHEVRLDVIDGVLLLTGCGRVEPLKALSIYLLRAFIIVCQHY